MKKLLIIFALFAISGCKEASEFIETNCEVLDQGILLVQFENNNEKRTITVNSKANVMTFKGTTYQDMKWSAELDKIDAFSIDKENVLEINYKDGEKFQFGKISNTCKETTQVYLGDQFQYN